MHVTTWLNSVEFVFMKNFILLIVYNTLSTFKYVFNFISEFSFYPISCRIIISLWVLNASLILLEFSFQSFALTATSRTCLSTWNVALYFWDSIGPGKCPLDLYLQLGKWINAIFLTLTQNINKSCNTMYP